MATRLKKNEKSIGRHLSLSSPSAFSQERALAFFWPTFCEVVMTVILLRTSLSLFLFSLSLSGVSLTLSVVSLSLFHGSFFFFLLVLLLSPFLLAHCGTSCSCFKKKNFSSNTFSSVARTITSERPPPSPRRPSQTPRARRRIPRGGR